MDSESDYNIGKQIVRGQSEDEWNELRLGKGEWPQEKKDWKIFRNYTMQQLKDSMKRGNK